MTNIREIPKKIAQFYSHCADNYHNDELSRSANRLGLISGAVLTLGSSLNIDNMKTRLNQEATVPLAIFTIAFFGIPVLINFIREKTGYYQK